MEVIRDGRRIIGWIDHELDGSWSYVFGKPSQRSYCKFYVDTEEMARSKLWEYHNSFKQTINSLKKEA